MTKTTMNYAEKLMATISEDAMSYVCATEEVNFNTMSRPALIKYCQDNNIEGYKEYKTKERLLQFIQNVTMTQEEEIEENAQINNEEQKEVVMSTIPVIKGRKDDERTMEEINKLPVKEKHAISYLINCVMPLKDKEQGFVKSYREIGQLGIMRFFNPSDIEEDIIGTRDEERYIKKLADAKKNERIYNCSPTGRYRHVDINSGLLLVDFSLNTDVFEDMMTKGLYVWNFNGESKFSINKPELTGPVCVRYFRAYAFSPSSVKHNKIYFAEINSKHSIEDRFNEIDSLTGFALRGAMKKLMKESKTNNNKNFFAEFAKLAVRAFARAITPMTPFGYTGNVLVVNTKTRPVDEFENKEDAETLEKAGMKIDTDFADGNSPIGIDYVINNFMKYYGRKLTREQALRVSLQVRASHFNLKGYAKVYSKEAMFIRTVALCEDYGKDIVLYNEKQGRFNGEEVLALLNGTEKEKAMITKAIKEIDIAGTKNEFKLINFEALDKGEKAEVSIINTFNCTESGHNIQQGNKVTDKFADEYAELVAAQAVFDYLKQDEELEGTSIKLDKNMKGLRGDVVHNCMRIAQTEDDRHDKALHTRMLRDKAKFITSKVAKMNSNGSSMYLVLTPWDMYLSKKQHVLRKRTVNHMDSFGKITKIECLEVYSAKFNNTYEKEIEPALEDAKASGMSEEELVMLEESLHVGMSIKHPSTNRKEFMPYYFMTDKEIEERLNEEEFNFTSEEKKTLIEYVCNSAYSEVLIANDNSLKSQCAGLDFDGDQVKVELHSFGPFDGKLIYGVPCIDTKEILNDYVSLMCDIVSQDKNIFHTPMISYDFTENNKEEYKKSSLIGKDKGSRKSYGKNYDNTIANANTTKKVNESYDKMTESMIGEFFTLSYTRFSHEASCGCDSELINEVTDLLGLLCATASIGDDIGTTIKKGGVVILSDVDRVWFADGSFNFELACKLFKPLKRNVEWNEQREIDREEKWTEAYTTVYTEGVNMFKFTNALGFTRIYYRVSQIEVDAFIEKIKRLSKGLTREEWLVLRDDFDNITRGLGESSIDVKKDLTKHLGSRMADIIESGFSCFGHIKAEELKSNIYSLTNSLRLDEDFEMYFGNFEIDEDGTPVNDKVLLDPIGAGKFNIYKKLGAYMKQSVDATKNTCNYNRYDKYDNIELVEQYPMSSYVVSYILDYYTELFGNNNSKLKSPSVEVRNAILYAALNTAKIEGCSVNDFISLGLYNACIYRNAKTLYAGGFNTNKNYIGGINTMYLVFGDLMAQVYNDGKPLVVELTVKSNNQQIPVGQVLEFNNGVCITKGFKMTLDEMFTGKAVALEDKLVTKWDCFKHFQDSHEDKNTVLLSLRSLAIIEDTWANFQEDTEKEGEEGFGISSLKYDRCGKLVKYTTKEKEEVLAIEDLDGTPVAILNNLAMDELIGKEIEIPIIAGTVDNGLIVARLV